MKPSRGRNAGHHLFERRRVYKKGRRESPGLNEAGHGARFVPTVACCPSSVPTPLLLWSSLSRKLGGVKEERTGNMTQRDKVTDGQKRRGLMHNVKGRKLEVLTL